MNTLSQWTRRTIAVAALAAACLSPSLHAQNEVVVARVDIPFAFDYGTRHCAPGIYTLSMQAPHVMVVHGGSISAMAMTQEEIALRPQAKSEVVFLKHNDHYILAEVRVAGHQNYLHTVRSKAEKRSDIAANHAIDTRVEVAMLDQPASPQK
jgi:hypothetical protein